MGATSMLHEVYSWWLPSGPGTKTKADWEPLQKAESWRNCGKQFTLW